MRYRLKIATWTVVREATEPSPRLLRDPINVARLALDLIRESDDDREHFWLGLLDGKHRLRLITEVSVGSQTASLDYLCQRVSVSLSSSFTHGRGGVQLSRFGWTAEEVPVIRVPPSLVTSEIAGPGGDRHPKVGARTRHTTTRGPKGVSRGSGCAKEDMCKR